MKFSCNIAEDMLPLYLDDSCSEDSRAALEEHLRECPSCQAKLTRMRGGIPDGIQAEHSGPKLAAYAKKVRKHRIRLAVCAVFVTIFASVVLALGYLTIQDMHREALLAFREVEAGTYNLTAGGLETTAEDIGHYVFYTNYTQIKVTVEGGDRFQGTVKLWDTANSGGFIQIQEVDETANTCVFTSCSAARRYQITCEHLDGAAVTVSEGRTVSFWRSLRSVLREITGG